METSPREEGDNGHNSLLGTKAVAIAMTVVAATARMPTGEKRATATGAKRAMAMMAAIAATTTTETISMVADG